MQGPPTTSMRRVAGTAVAAGVMVVVMVAVLALAGGCTSPAGSSIRLVAGFYPLQFVAEQVGAGQVSVTNLAQPGAEPHDLELSPRQVADVASADLIIYVAGFQPALDDAVRQHGTASSFDAATVVPLLDASAEKDPHFWLDPTRLATLAGAVADRLADADPAGAEGYRTRAAALASRLGELDRTFTERLRACRSREIVTSHAAFGYLADRYGLVQIGITGLNPEVEPTPRRLAQIAAEARRHGATTIFFETLVSPDVAEAIAAEVGARTGMLDPLEGLAGDATGDYFSVMRANLSTLETALECT